MESSKAESANLVLKLYELRRDPEMREAREWYVTKFNPKSAEEIVKLLTESFEGSRYYRMVTSYWDMASSLVNNGAIDRTIFLDANTEHVAIFARVQPFLAEVQKIYRPTYLKQLETLVMSMPDIEKLLAGRVKLLDSWGKGAQKGGDVGFKP
ncbi:MAG: DUF4760 domain-containing protein [Candidatus Kapaibacteriota bacterium]